MWRVVLASAVFLVFVVWTPAPAQGIDDFVDIWVGIHPGSLPQLIIGRSGENLTAHGFGSCHPTWCDWGEITVPFSGNPIVAVYEQGFKTNKLTICLASEDYPYVQSHNVFRDGSNCQ